ncbi:hypothetical protein [Aeromicrobium duanguangcaii]|uniref:Uncharacterized protein n=1 Tax=Aeromicrobium duanguangcaii TaxID=2968086 RepID=A0ABY5KML8_9ACTN|nr:hypothetical protein [Aeromicrobium duanguangcaii]MCD9153328.1 hypothetical protein [Aeromicrobium duanguangcaii]UUI69578.1 hypothetical protein NP095_05640 [Aeromicrobium duanguangcaii]
MHQPTDRFHRAAYHSRVTLAKKKVTAGRQQVVKVRQLRPGSTAKIRYRGTLLATVTVNSKGTVKVVKRGRAGGSKVTISRGKQAVNLRFKVGKKRGKAAVVLTASGSPRVAQKFTVTKKR